MQNYSNQTNFFVKIYGNTVKQISGLESFECSVTGMPTPEIAIGTGNYSPHPLAGLANKSTKGRIAGNALTNDDLIDLEFIVDENLESYIFIIKWMVAMTTKGRNLPVGVDNEDFFEVVAVDNQKQPVLIFKYNKAFPTRLSPIQYSAQLTDPAPTVIPVSIAYDSFNITDRYGNELI